MRWWQHWWWCHCFSLRMTRKAAWFASSWSTGSGCVRIWRERACWLSSSVSERSSSASRCVRASPWRIQVSQCSLSVFLRECNIFCFAVIWKMTISKYYFIDNISSDIESYCYWRVFIVAASAVCHWNEADTFSHSTAPHHGSIGGARRDVIVQRACWPRRGSLTYAVTLRSRLWLCLELSSHQQRFCHLSCALCFWKSVA